MAYPTGINFQPTTPLAGTQPINQASTTKAHSLGTRIRAADANYGEIECVYLAGVANTAAGDIVTYDQKAGTTTRGTAGGVKGPVAVAMAAIGAGSYGWYAVSGSVPVNSGTVAANTRAYGTATGGQIDDAVSATNAIDGMFIRSADAGGFATAQLDRPSINGNG
jgi:hypothetical protein